MTPLEWNWYIEYSSDYHGYLYAIRKYLFSDETPFQKVDIVDTFTYGRLLILDGKTQSAEFDEHIYHEALVHPAAVMHPGPAKVMVMGGGEGAVLRELCRYDNIEEVVMVDIDSKVVEMCIKHLPEWHQGSFDDSRVELLHMDARRYLEETDKKFDIIYSDLTEPAEEGPSKMLFTREFYNMIKTKLNPGGILAVQSGGFSLDYLSIHSAIRNTMEMNFDNVRSYHTFIPSFDCSWGYIIASADSELLNISRAEVDRRLSPIADQLRFYDGETHEGMFCIPKDIRKALHDDQTIIEDDKPVNF
ncbi:MAG: polyamine aminopropyltransferase [Firmicutes bacterium]|nr:polyamine aminopropyltransferase [Bacillota bacterium]